MTQTPINPYAILINDRDRQQLMDLLQWLYTARPDLVEQIRGEDESAPEPKPTRWSALKACLRQIRDFACVHPDSLHGHYRVTPELKKSARATAAAMTASNLIDAAGGMPIFFFAAKSFTVIPALGFSLVMTALVLHFGNALSVVSVQGRKGHFTLAAAAFIPLVLLNIVQTLATGVGAEVFNNQPELAQLRAREALDHLAQTQEENIHQLVANPPALVTECRQARQSLEAMPRQTALHEKAFQSRYVRIYGTFQSQSQRSAVPWEKQPLCVRANPLEKEHQEQLDVQRLELAQFQQRWAETGNDVAYLQQTAPTQYDKIFVETKPWFSEETEIQLRSGIELVTLGTRNFFGKLAAGEWEQLGLNLFLASVSAVTSLASLTLALGLTLSQDAQRSYDREEMERVNQWFRQMRLTLSTLHQEQLEQLRQSEQPEDPSLPDELNRLN